jgi:hypothetical protein
MYEQKTCTAHSHSIFIICLVSQLGSQTGYSVAQPQQSFHLLA